MEFSEGQLYWNRHRMDHKPLCRGFNAGDHADKSRRAIRIHSSEKDHLFSKPLEFSRDPCKVERPIRVYLRQRGHCPVAQYPGGAKGLGLILVRWKCCVSAAPSTRTSAASCCKGNCYQ